MAAKILITGAGGQVGQALAAADSRYETIALGKDELDICALDQIESVFMQHAPDLVINAAAYTQVDRAEEQRALAFAINRDGVANLASACRNRGIPLLHISTDYVFDGSREGAYAEDDPIAPLGVYGESKAEGEALLRRILPEHVILRTSWVFSATGNNFVKTMLRLGRERDTLGIVDDQYGCPTSARSIADVLITIAESYLGGGEVDWGTYHFRNDPPVTWYQFARTIFCLSQGYEHLVVNPISSDAYPTPAVRPQNSVLACSKIEDRFGTSLVNWETELEFVLDILGVKKKGP